MTEGVHARQGDHGGLDLGLARAMEARGSLAVGSLMKRPSGGIIEAWKVHQTAFQPPSWFDCADMSSTRRRNEQGSQ